MKEVFRRLMQFFAGLSRSEECEFTLEPVIELQPVLRVGMGSNEVRGILRDAFPGASIYLSDNAKFLCDISDIEAFLKQDETNQYEYEAEGLDCDDFTFMLMGQFSKPGWAQLWKFIAWNDKHALMGFIDTNMDFWWIEPQSDRIQSKLEDWQGSAVATYIIMG